MPTSTHPSLGINGGYNPVTSAPIITALQAAIVPGAKIFASDINSLINLWNAFNSHTHGVSDLYGIYDFGNTNPPGYAGPPGSSEPTTTAGPNLNPDIAVVSVGDIVLAAKANELVSAFAGQASHTHQWTDRTS